MHNTRSFLYLIYLNIIELIFRWKKNYLINNDVKCIKSESDLNEVFGLLYQKDIISFDIFGTLIIRKHKDPAEIFKLIGEKLQIKDFIKIRSDTELEVRKIKRKDEGHNEVNLSEIWMSIERKFGIPKEIGIQIELETEIENCIGNSQLMNLISKVIDTKKKFICLSDMYLSSKDLEYFLLKLGYPKPEYILVSNEHNCSKQSGGLYKLLKEKESNSQKITHIGDDLYSDVFMAKKMGIDSMFCGI